MTLHDIGFAAGHTISTGHGRDNADRMSALRCLRPIWVKSGKAQNEQMLSALPPKCMDPPCVARENGEAGVRSCTNVSGLALELVRRTIIEIRTHPILLAAMPLRAISGVSSRMRREDQFSISSLSLADLGGETIAG